MSSVKQCLSRIDADAWLRVCVCNHAAFVGMISKVGDDIPHHAGLTLVNICTEFRWIDNEKTGGVRCVTVEAVICS